MASSLSIVLVRMLILIIIVVTTIIPVVTSFTTVQRQSSSSSSSLTISSGNVDTTTTICTTSSFRTTASQIQNVVNKNTRFYKVLSLSSSQEQQQQQQQDDEFTKFAASLLENDNNSNNDGITTSTFVNKVNGDTKAIMEGSTKSEINTATRSTTTTTTTTFVSQQPKQVPTSKKSTTTNNNNNSQIWQAELETLLAFDPTVPISKRQQSFYNLLNANEQIRTATIKALQNRNIDPLLTPTQRKLQEGTRAVARQVTDDIIPSIVETVRQGSTAAVIGTTGSTSSSSSTSTIISPNDVTRIGGRMFNAFNTQIRQNLQTFAGDVMNPSRIPQRISQQTEDIVKEVQNVFAETPIGLKGPKYTVVYSTDSYEVRDYEQYNVATTTMGTIQDPTTPITTKSVDIWSLTEQGAAFNTLASYIFGANKQQLVMDMTTPVTTTMTGEMRFYVDVPIPPEPIQPQQDDDNNNNSNNKPQFLEQARQQSRTNISIETIPPSRLAVRKFTGFVTAGEVQRQKDALLTAIAFDENYIQLDIPHGSTVGHVIFQYNPPYTIPFIRRNEIAIPVTLVNYTE